MKMIKAIIRPEKEIDVVSGLEEDGFYALTKVDVLGRGKQRGIQIGETIYEELAKLMLLLVVEDEDWEKAVDSIEKHAHTGNYGDGKIFIMDVADSYTIRTKEKGL